MDSLFIDLIEARDLEADCALVNLQSFSQRFNRDADMINFHLSL